MPVLRKFCQLYQGALDDEFCRLLLELDRDGKNLVEGKHVGAHGAEYRKSEVFWVRLPNLDKLLIKS